MEKEYFFGFLFFFSFLNKHTLISFGSPPQTMWTIKEKNRNPITLLSKPFKPDEDLIGLVKTWKVIRTPQSDDVSGEIPLLRDRFSRHFKTRTEYFISDRI